MEPKEDKKTNTADHLANERTLLAWIRTGIGIIAFGFVLIKTPSLVAGENGTQLYKYNQYSVIAGFIMVFLATFSLLFAYIGYRRTKKQLENNTYSHSSVLLLTLILALFFAGMLLGLLMLKDYL